MTFWNTFAATLWAITFVRLADLAVGYVASIRHRKQFDRLLDELHDAWEEEEAKKPVRKKAVAKKK